MKKQFWAILFFLSFCCTSIICAQNLRLNVVGESVPKSKIIDALNYKKNFSDFNSLKAEVDTLQIRLLRKGYIDTAIKSIYKVNDSTYESLFYLGKKVERIHIYYSDELDIKILETHLKREKLINGIINYISKNSLQIQGFSSSEKEVFGENS